MTAIAEDQVGVPGQPREPPRPQLLGTTSGTEPAVSDWLYCGEQFAMEGCLASAPLGVGTQQYEFVRLQELSRGAAGAGGYDQQLATADNQNDRQ